MRWFLVVAVAVMATGCGSDEKTASETIRAQKAKVQTTCAEGINCDAPAKKPFGRSCKSARDGNRGSGVRTCWGPDPNHPNPTIERRTPSGWKLVTGPLKPSALDAMWVASGSRRIDARCSRSGSTRAIAERWSSCRPAAAHLAWSRARRIGATHRSLRVWVGPRTAGRGCMCSGAGGGTSPVLTSSTPARLPVTRGPSLSPAARLCAFAVRQRRCDMTTIAPSGRRA